MIVLGIESSCDDTGAAILDDGRERSSVVVSQDEVHAPFGGIVPELAARSHLGRIVPAVNEALANAAITLADVEAIAVTRGPGLVGSLLVGLSLGKAIARRRGIPLVGVHHIEGHLLAAELERPVTRPFLGLVVSGGHSALYWVTRDDRYFLLGKTRDDAAGEAFDKAAKRLGLGYPGGREIERLARSGNPAALNLPRTRVRGEACDLSFSGLKTALAVALERDPTIRPEDAAAAFQAAVVANLADVTRRAVAATGAACVVLTGGVAANAALREELTRMAAEEGAELVVPARARCTDNAAMIAHAGWRRLRRGESDALDINAVADLPLGPRLSVSEIRGLAP